MHSSKQMNLKKAILFFLLATLPFLMLINPASCSTAGITEVEVNPIEDAYVKSNEANTNFGDASYLYARFWDYSTDSYDVRCNSYLKFDISAVSSTANIVYANLEMYCWSAWSPTPNIGVHYCPDDSWNEDVITWNTAPSFSSTPTSTLRISSYYQWYTWDITDTIKATINDGILTVVLKAQDVGDSFESSFYSKENSSSNHPKLVIGYATQTFCSVSTTIVTLGNSVTVSGGIPLMDSDTVQLTYTKPDMSTIVRTVATDSDGNFVDTYLASLVGMWSVTAAWAGGGGYAASSSTELFLVTANERNSWAIVVGVSDYKEISDLSYTDNDAIDLSNRLKEIWPEDHVRLLVDENATRANIESAIKDWLAPKGALESVLFFFSGHGCTGPDEAPIDETDGEDEYICPYDSLTYSYANDIRDETLDSWLLLLNSQRISVFLDSCYSGGFIDKVTAKELPVSVDVDDHFVKDLSRVGRVIIASSAETETSAESNSLRHGVFAYYMLDALDNLELLDYNANSEISAEEIFVYVAPLVRTYTDYDQNPQMYDGYVGELSLIAMLRVYFDSNPCTATIIVDQLSYTTPVSFLWPLYTEHTFTISNQVSHDYEGTKYLFNSWNDGSDLTSRTMIFSEFSSSLYTANYDTQYFLWVDSDYGSPRGEGWYDDGDTASFDVASVVSVSEGTRVVFTGWSGDTSSTSATSTLVMDSPKEVVAEWMTQYFLSVDSDYGDPQGEGWYDSGGTASFSVPSTVSLSGGTRVIFARWSGDTSSTVPSSTLLMNEPKQVSAGWQTQYYLTVDSDYGSPQGEGWYDTGATSYFEVASIVDVNEVTRVVFTGWSGDVTSSSSMDNLVMDAPKQITAEWQTQYYLSAAAEPAGIVSLDCQGWYDEGAQVLTETVPTECSGGEGMRYIFDTWKIDAVAGGSDSVSVLMNAPHSAVASYQTHYYLTVVSEYDPTEGEGWYVKDSQASFSVQSPQGFVIQNVFVRWGGDSTSTSQSATVMMDGPKTVIAIWREDYTQLYIIILAVAVLAIIALILVRKLRAH